MRIGIVSSKKSVLQISKEVASAFRSEINGVEVKEKIAPTNLDVIAEVASMAGFDLVIVLVYYERQTADIHVLMEKLVELDSSGLKIMKFVEDVEEIEEASEVSRVVDAVVSRLFGGRNNGSDSKGSYSTL